MKPDLYRLLEEFLKLTGSMEARNDIYVEFLQAPHHPTKLPKGKQAIYGFYWNNDWLKIGKAGANSAPRYQYQHYNPRSGRSNLAKSILSDASLKNLDLKADSVGEWLRSNTDRVNILISETISDKLVTLLEAFLHYHLNPRYEGRER